MVGVKNNSDVVVSLASRLLVHPNLFRLPLLLSLKPPLHRSLHDAPDLIPTDPQKARRTQDVARLHHLNRQPLKKRGKRGFLLRPPARRYLPYPVFLTANPGSMRMEKRPKLTAVQMTPAPFRRMVVQRHHPLTLKAWPFDPLSMANPNLHSLFLYVQFHSLYLLWGSRPNK